LAARDVVIKARGLTKRYGDFEAVKGISFDIFRGECFGFLGPNGAGKTTTIRMIHCFTPMSSGSLEILGWEVPAHARRVKYLLGVVHQENNLDPELTVYENLLLYAFYFDLPPSTARKRAEELMEFMGLRERSSHPVEQLSGGMQRRLAVARALINHPRILILDEPTTGLDPEVRRLLWEKLRELKKQGLTLILTTHYMEEAAQLCDRLVIMDKGQILALGSPGELVEKYVGREVVEITPRDGGEKIRAFAQVNGFSWQIIGNTFYFYTQEGREVFKALENLDLSPLHLALRTATLEDVFLKLTGRNLT